MTNCFDCKKLNRETGLCEIHLDVTVFDCPDFEPIHLKGEQEE